MNPWHDERMEGAASVIPAVLVFEFPRGVRADRAVDDRGPGADERGHDEGRESDDTAAEAIQIYRSNVMRSLISIVAATAAFSFTPLGSTLAQAGERPGPHWEVSVLGGVNAFSQNDTAIPDNLWGVPLAAGASYRFTRNIAAEGEFTWFVPMKQDVDMAQGTEQRKAPNALAYQVGIRGTLPLANWSPYLAAGAGAMTFLSDTDADRVPQLSESQTVFALNFGGGAQFPVSPRWGLRAEYREFVGFPGSDTAGLSSNGNADAIWLSRGVVGVDYRF